MVDRSQMPLIQKMAQVEFPQPGEESLSQGGRLVTLATPAPGLVVLHVVLPGGTWVERKRGVASFAAELLIAGCQGSSAEDVRSTMAEYGASCQGYATKDGFHWHITMLKEHVAVLLPLFMNCLCLPAFCRKALNVLKKKVHQRIQQREANIQRRAERALHQACFPSPHPYGAILQVEDLERITRKDLLTHHSALPWSEAKLFLVGDIALEEKSLVQQTWNPLKSIATPFAHHPLKDVWPKTKHFLPHAGSMQTALALGLPSITKQHPDFIPFYIAQVVLGGYFGSRLMQNIREKKGYAYGISSKLSAFRHHSLFAIQTSVKKEHAQAALDEIRKEIQLLQATPPSLKECERVRNVLAGHLMGGFDALGEVAHKLVTTYSLDLDLSFYDTLYNKIGSFVPEEVTEMLKQYLPLDQCHEVKVGEN